MVKLPPVVLDSDSILVWVYVMPKLLTGPVDSVTVNVITGSEAVSGKAGVTLLPFFLEERQEGLD